MLKLSILISYCSFKYLTNTLKTRIYINYWSYFQDEYKDITIQSEKKLDTETNSKDSALIDITENISRNDIETKKDVIVEKSDTKKSDVKLIEIFDTDMVFDSDSSLFTPSQLLMQNVNLFNLDDPIESEKSNQTKEKMSSFFEKLTKMQGTVEKTNNEPNKANNSMTNIPSKTNKEKLAWFDLFADLDPLSNNVEANVIDNSAVNSHAA